MASLVLRSASDAIIGVDPRLSVVAFNPAAERLYGYRSGDVIGRSAHMLVPPRLYDAVDRLKVSMRDAPPLEIETQVRHRDGHRIDVHLSLAPMRARDGQLRGACAVIKDITDRKHRRHLLATQLTRLRELSAKPVDLRAPGRPSPTTPQETPETELTAGIERTLRVAREQLGMDVAWVGEAAHGLTDGSDIRVPVRYSDGRLYGILCCSSPNPDHDLDDRDAQFLRALSKFLEEDLERAELRTENRRMAGRLDAVSALLAALNARDRYTADHSRSVVDLSVSVARAMRLGLETVDEVEQVALLHDLGKVGIPDSILQKPGPLSEEEWELMRQHPVIGAEIVSSVGSLAHLAHAVRAEHERWDGTGYPDRLAREEIPIASRITLACDAYHAMTSDRPYRRAMSTGEAVIELRLCAGSQFDPAIVEALVRVLKPGNLTPAG